MSGKQRKYTKFMQQVVFSMLNQIYLSAFCLKILFSSSIFFIFKFSRMDQDKSLNISYDEWRDFLLLAPSSDLHDILRFWRHSTVSEIIFTSKFYKWRFAWMPNAKCKMKFQEKKFKADKFTQGKLFYESLDGINPNVLVWIN